MNQRLFAFMAPPAPSFASCLYASCLVLSRLLDRQIVRDHGIGSDVWIAATEMGIIPGGVLSANVMDPSWDRVFAVLMNQTCNN